MSKVGKQGFRVFASRNLPLILASIFTSGFLGWTIYFFLRPNCGLVGCENRLITFLASTNNEMGDTLAGFVGSLTLVWVVASVWQQSIELRDQRREFAKMATAQDLQVEALDAQIVILQDEKRRRDEKEADDEYDALLSVMLGIAGSENFVGLKYSFVKSPAPAGLDRCEYSLFQNPIAIRSPANPLECVREVVWSVANVMKSTVATHEENGYALEDCKQLCFEIRLFSNALLELEGKIPELSAAGRVKARYMNFGESASSLDAELQLLSLSNTC